MRLTRGALATVAVVLVAGVVAFGAGLALRDHLASGDAPRPSGRRPPTPSAGSAPEVPPPLTFTDQDDRPQRLDRYRGKVVLVNFWATWCPPCLHEIPMLTALQRDLGPRGLQVLGVALDEADNVRRFARETGLNYPTSTDRPAAFDLLRGFGNDTGGLPFTAVIDRGGRIVFRRAGEMFREDALGVIEPLL